MAKSTEFVSPVEIELQRRRRVKRFGVFVVLFIVATFLYWRIIPESPQLYSDIEDHFKYGSIGSDNTERGLPYWVWKVLPEMFPQHLPPGPGNGYERFGLITEAGRDRPIGFSVRRVSGLDLIGLNCALCHTGSIRESESSERKIVLGMPSHGLNLQGYFRFLFDCVADPAFTDDAVMEKVRSVARLDPYERIAYPIAVRRVREAVQRQSDLFTYWWNHSEPWGNGRVDTFNPYILLFFRTGAPNRPPLDIQVPSAAADFPSLWHQLPREGMELHWDGNNPRVDERNISAAIGAGVVYRYHDEQPTTTLDQESIHRVREWINELGPSVHFPPERINRDLLVEGQALYAQYCLDCHGSPNPKDRFAGKRVGKVVPIDDIRTDPNRLNSFTPELAEVMLTIGKGLEWQFRSFRKTNGYSNMPLDGIWLRAPYLHNGSVPTLAALLEPAANRPKTFYRGYDVYSWEQLGFKSDVPEENGRKFYLFDTSRPGNSNLGHDGPEYGTDLPPAKKQALLEYLKTF